MNKRQVISSLNNIAEELDMNGLYVEAKQVTNVMRKIAQVPDQASNQVPVNPDVNGTPKEALDFYTQQMSGEVGKIVVQMRRTLQVVLANYNDKKKFFNDPVWGAELKKDITNDMNALNVMISAYKNLPKAE